MFKVIVPEWEYYFVKSKKTNPKYWLYKDRNKLPIKYKNLLSNQPLVVSGKAYCCTSDKKRFLKNPIKVGKENIWVLNGQQFYSGTMDWRLREKIVTYYHNYFCKYIQEQLDPIILTNGEYLSISCDIYDIKRGNMPDVSNMWLLEKFFEDALQECNIISDDGPNIVLESGRKRYHWVKTPEERQLVFIIKKITE